MSTIETEQSAIVVADGSTCTNPSRLAEIAVAVKDTLKKGLRAERGLTNLAKSLASLRVEARSLILNAAGLPEWSQAVMTDQYRATIEAAEASVWADADAGEKRSFDGRIRQHISRNFLEPAIVDYVLRTVQGMPEAGTLKWTEAKNGIPAVLAEVPDAVKKAVAAEYRRCKLEVPVKFGGAVKGTKGSGPVKGDPENPRAAFETALGAMEHLAPLLTATDLLRALSALSTKVRAKGFVFDGNTRGETEAILLRCGIVATGTAKFLHGKSTEKDLAEVDSAAWTKEDQQ